jgi:hypothetical protein
MLRLEEQLQKAVADLTEKVKQHKGEVAFCLREFSVMGRDTGGIMGPSSHDSHYYETGIITGEMQKNKDPEMERINLPDLTLRRGGEDRPHHYLWGHYSVPVDRKLTGFVNLFQNIFQFDIKDLEELKQGNLSIDLRDFDISDPLLFLLHHDRDSHLRRTDFLIGDEEVERFLKEKKFRNYPELFSVLKNPVSVEGRISEHYSQEAKELGEKIVITANEVASAFRKVQALEENVMKATYGWKVDYDERYAAWDDFHREQVDKYQGLREVISKNIKTLKEQLLKEENPKLLKIANFSLLDGEIIGFPARVLVNDYLNYIKKYLIPEIEGTFAKIDSYLSEQRKKASR